MCLKEAKSDGQRDDGQDGQGQVSDSDSDGQGVQGDDQDEGQGGHPSALLMQWEFLEGSSNWSARALNVALL
jgi:hypothetical protein